MNTMTHNTLALKRLLGPALLAFALLCLALPALGQAPTAESTESIQVEQQAAQEEQQRAVILPSPPMPEFLNDNLVPVVAIVSIFAVPPLAILLFALLVFRHRVKQQQLMNERLQRFLEAGQPIPEQLLNIGAVEPGPTQHLNWGLTLLGLGLGLGIFLGLISDWKIASLALIPVALGIAKLISWKMATRQQA